MSLVPTDAPTSLTQRLTEPLDQQALIGVSNKLLCAPFLALGLWTWTMIIGEPLTASIYGLAALSFSVPFLTVAGFAGALLAWRNAQVQYEQNFPVLGHTYALLGLYGATTTGLLGLSQMLMVVRAL